MANVQITQLPAAQPLNGSELVPIVQNGITVRTTTAAVAGSPAQQQTFLTLNQEPTLPNSRRLSGSSGIALTDGGAQGALTVALTGAAASLNGAGTGVIVKTGGNTVTGRTIQVTGAGLQISNGDGVSGNPVISLSGLAAQFAGFVGTGLVAVINGTSVAGTQIVGTAGQIAVANGDAGAGNPTLSLTNTGVIAGSYGAVDRALIATVDVQGRLSSLSDAPIAIDASQITNGQLPIVRGGTGASTSDGALTNLLPAQSGQNGKVLATDGSTTFWLSTAGTGTVTSVDVSGGTTGLTTSGGPIVSAGTIVLGGTLNVANGGTGTSTLTGYVIGNGTSAMTASATIPTTDLSGTISNAQLANSAITINGSNVSLGGSVTVTATATNALTIGTGLSGTSYNGSAPVTIAIDSTVATLTGTQTLTNKTIDANSNTLSNIPNSALTNSSVTIGTTGISLGGTATTLGGLTSVAVTQDPTSALQLATKQYVDAVAEGLHVHASCAAGTTGTLASITGGTVTYNNGTAGVGATLTLSSPLTILDGYTLQPTDRILVKNEATQANNGIYTWATGGTVLTRATDFDTSVEIASGDFTFISNGTLYANTGWVQTQPVATIGTDPIVWQQFSGAGTYTAGTGLTLAGNQFSITNTGVTAATYGSASAVPVIAVNAQGQITTASDASISINGNQITSGTVGSSYISGSYTGITGVGTLTAGTWNASTISTAYGGTGLTSYTAGDIVYYVTGTALSKLAVGTAGQVLTSSGTAPQYVDQSTLSVGSATNATNAANTGITANSTNATNYLTFVSATSGNLPQLVNSSITCNPSTGAITGGIAGGTF